MTRGVGELALVRTLPDAVVAAFGALTHLGNPWVLLGGLSVLYVASHRLGLDRRRVAVVVAAGFAALGVTLALKSAFALPRPPGAAATGYGFPSGHALGTTVVWVGAAAVLDVGRRRSRAAVAGAVVLAVAASRVVIGVHYLVDVVAGVVAGLALLWVSGAVAARGVSSDRDSGGPTTDAATLPSDARAPPTHGAVARVFALAVGAALVALAVDTKPDTLLAVGVTAGGWWGWRAAEPAAADAASLSHRGTVVAAAGLPVVLAGLLLVERVAATLPGVVTVLIASLLGGVLLSLPRIGDRVAGDGS